jgi:hypothetical protein
MRIGVLETEVAPYRHLLSVLEQALPVRFHECGADALLSEAAVVRLAAADSESTGPGPRQRAFVVATGSGEPGGGTAVTFESARELDRRLRGAELADPAAASAVRLGADGGTVLARSSDGPLWMRRGEHDRVAVPPKPLEAGTPLQSLLRAEDWLSLLPLLHFLRETTAAEASDPPPLRASFLVDDPNLHRPRYGHISYPELVAHSDQHGYHTAFATVPLDAWLVHRGAARLFREHRDRISLLFHGNDHLKRELGRERTGPETRAMLAQARRRIARLERQAGVEVDRVMAPPHGACSLETMRTLPAVGFEAACVSRPYPWLDGPPPERPLAAWHAATMVAAGTPVVPRIPIADARGELPLRAFLDQPLVVYGHHQDVAGGLEPFAELAGLINAFGDVRWTGVTAISRSNYSTRIEGGELVVGALARRVDVEVPAGVEALRVELAAPEESPAWREVVVDGTRRELRDAGSVWSSEAVPVRPGARVGVEVPVPAPIDPHDVARPRGGPWPLARRVLVEARDRIEPVRRH